MIGFARSAIVRERLWYLSMLFVLPEFQGPGLGRDLLGRVLPDRWRMARATATDSAQPISNAMYASHGMVPRMPLLSLVGLPRRPEAFGDAAIRGRARRLRRDRRPGRPTVTATGCWSRRSTPSIASCSASPIRPITAFLRTESRHGWLYRGPDGTPVGYGYAGEAGRVGPDRRPRRGAARARPRPPDLGRRAARRLRDWVGGAADRAVVPALRAGFRLDQFPVLLCWDRPFADFSRYLPISPGLL